MVFFLIVGIGPAGHCNYFTHKGHTFCTAVLFLRIFFFLPLFPVSGPMLLVDPMPCVRTYRKMSFKECHGGAMCLCMVFAYLRWLTFGLISLFQHQASDPSALLGAAVGAAGVQQAAAKSAVGRAGAPPPGGVVVGVPVGSGAAAGEKQPLLLNADGGDGAPRAAAETEDSVDPIDAIV